MPDSFQSPIGGPTDPYKYRVDEIQKDKNEREKPEPPRHSIHAILAYFLLLVGKLIDLFSAKESEEAVVDVKDHLIQFKAALEELAAYDLSQDVGFLEKISTLWHLLLEDLSTLGATDPIARRLREFSKQLQHYPAGEEHSLGYYFSEYAGEKWLPYPYMGIIATLHRDFVQDKKASQLHRWVDMLDEMISLRNASFG